MLGRFSDSVTITVVGATQCSESNISINNCPPTTTYKQLYFKQPNGIYFYLFLAHYRIQPYDVTFNPTKAYFCTGGIVAMK